MIARRGVRRAYGALAVRRRRAGQCMETVVRNDRRWAGDDHLGGRPTAVRSFSGKPTVPTVHRRARQAGTIRV